MALTVEDFIAQFRLDTDDPVLDDVNDALWSDDEIIRYVNLAQRAVAKTAEVLLDRSTAAITQYTVTASDPWITLDPRVIKIRRATLVTAKRKLALKTLEQMDAGYSSDDYGNSLSSSSMGWEDIVSTPTIGVTNMETNKFRLAPIPAEADTLQLVVVRYPVEEIITEGSPIEIVDDKSQLAMLDYMKYLGYQKHDADIRSEELADKFLLNFARKAADVKREHSRLHKPSGTVTYGGL